MKKNIYSSYAVLILLTIILTACSPSPKNDHVPVTTQSPIQDPAKPIAVPTDLPKPTDPPIPTAIEAPSLITESVDVGQGFWFTYGSNFWEVGSPSSFPYLVAINENSCRVRYQYGHGMDPSQFDFTNGDETIGDTLFNVSRWTKKTTGEPVVIAFHYNDLDYFSLEGPGAEVLSEECIEEAYKMIELSLDKGFSQ